ncbi:MAG: exodeoxyribonuclease V subunit gamma [Desulfococcaceae bacterium]
MTLFHLHTGNRMEILVAALADALGDTPLSDPMAPETIIVQSLGMARWVSMELAKFHGICANVVFPLPNAFLYKEIFRKLVDDLPEKDPFARERTVWRVLRMLPDFHDRPEFAPLRRYLRRDDDGLRRFQLAGRIADLFDQYIIYRSDMIRKWDRGEEPDNWQAILWRAMAEEIGQKHRADVADEVQKQLADPNIDLIQKGVPERVSIFGISALPPFHIEMFAALSRRIPVRVFLLNPTHGYWGNILSKPEVRRFSAKGEAAGIPEAHLHLLQGNRLLSSLGIMGRDFLELIVDITNPQSAEAARRFQHFELDLAPEETSLLTALQSDIFHLRERPDAEDEDGAGDGTENESLNPEEREARKTPVDPDDDSVQIHICHGPMREVEVLHDRLLAMFEEDKALRPRDVLVMIPEVQQYAPYIQAVFERDFGDPRRIPFSIADRKIREESHVVSTFLELLDMAGGRFRAGRVLDLLESPPVRRRFGLESAADLEAIRGWIRDAGIRWGIDAENRAELGLPKIGDHTWRAGLDRLLLGYAMRPGEADRMFGGILPLDGVEGNAAAALGPFLAFTHALFTRLREMETPRTPAEWAEALEALLDAFFLPEEETEREVQLVRQALVDLSEGSEAAGLDTPLEPAVLRAYLAKELDKDPFGAGFITGGVTFCRTLPMRSIPFRVIALVGLNSSDFPRPHRPVSFDLMAQKPRPGDRTNRDNDRYLFLEALLSARDKLYISYVGQNIRDNTEMPPSVLVSELTDVIAAGFRDADGGDLLRNRIEFRHPLQAFSPAYFRGGENGSNPRFFSFSDGNCETARRLQANRTPPAPFLPVPLAEPEPAFFDLDVAVLGRFFRDPAKFLLNQRLDVFLEADEDLVEEDEPFEVDALAGYGLKADLLHRRLRDESLEARFETLRAAGALPHGTVGTVAFDQVRTAVEELAGRVRPHVAGGSLEPLPVSWSGNGFRLSGRIGNLYPEAMVRYRPAKLKGKDYIAAWIDHLLLNLCGGKALPRTTRVIGDGGTSFGFRPVAEPEGYLMTLLALYADGLKRPLPFFPESAWEYAHYRFLKGKEADYALQKARSKWEGGYYSGEKEKSPYFTRCFAHEDPIGPDFEGIVTRVFGPLTDHLDDFAA